MLEFETGVAAEISGGASVRDMITLADWRRRLYELYATIRSMSDPAQACRVWRTRRDALLRDHPQSPLSSSERATFSGLPYFGYNAPRAISSISSRSSATRPRPRASATTARSASRPLRARAALRLRWAAS